MIKVNSPNTEVVLEAQQFVSTIGLPFVQRVSVVRCQSASYLPWHEHPFFELLLLNDGAATYEFLSGELAELTGGQFMIVAPNTMHRGLQNVRRPSKSCGLMISPELDAFERHTPFDAQDLNWIHQQLNQYPNQPFKMGSRLKRFAGELTYKVSQFDPESRQSVLNLRVKICQVLYEAAKDAGCPHSIQLAATVSTIVKFMREHLDHPTCIDDVAAFAGCSRSKLYEIFRESTGMTPNDYWQRLRIEMAYDRIVHSNESITQIALNCGFNTSQYFCTVFRKYWGLSPRECRNRDRSTERSGR